MPRPKSDEKRRGLLVKLLEEERQVIAENAATAGLNVCEYIRRCAINKRIRSRVGAQVIGELSRLGGLQKHLLTQIKSHPHEAQLRAQLNDTLNDLHATLRTLIRAYAHKE